MKKTQVNLGKGFKRIYFIIAGLWIALMFLGINGRYRMYVLREKEWVF